jgi:hypothetical protein
MPYWLTSAWPGNRDPDADLDVAVTMGTGSWYARDLAGDGPPPGWPARTAALIWRAVGGRIARH